MAKMSRDTRQYRRKKLSFLIKYQTGGSATSSSRVTNLQNISAGGLAFLTEDNLRIGDLVSLSILIPSFEKPVEVEGKVVRIEPGPKKGRGIIAAVQYTKMDATSRKAMEEFDTELAKEQKKTGGKKGALFVDLSRFFAKKG